MKDENCENCKYYKVLSKESGVCRRYPPKMWDNKNPVAVSLGIDTRYNYVNNDDWCGEFTTKK